MPAWLDHSQPVVIVSGSVNSSSSISSGTGPGPNLVWLIVGMDASGDTQPNNGGLTVTVTQPGPGSFSRILWRPQQSANFPGPFYWRGLYPVFGSQVVAASATINFEVSVWGLLVPDYTVDG